MCVAKFLFIKWLAKRVQRTISMSWRKKTGKYKASSISIEKEIAKTDKDGNQLIKVDNYFLWNKYYW